MPYTLEQLKDRVSEVAARYGVRSVCLFGSYARGEASSKSDVDLLVDKGKIKGLFALAGFMSDVEEILGMPVDIVTTDSLDSKFLENIKSEEVLLYEFIQ